MHYWIIYQPGVGGHGFTNLLEHASNIQPIDNNLQWRIHYRPGRFGILDRPIKFYPSEVDNLSNIVDKNVVLCAHPYNQRVENLSTVDNNILIHLTSSDVARVIKDQNIKTNFKLDPVTFPAHYRTVQTKLFKMPCFKAHIDIEQAWRDWDYLKQHLDALGIDLDKTYYDQYITYIDL